MASHATNPQAADPPRATGSSHDRILQAAKNLFATRGYENTSTVAIARAAGTSESQLMKHFGNKEGLLEAIFDRGWVAIAENLRTIQGAPSPEHKLRVLLDATLTGLENDPELKQLMLLEGRRIRKEGHMVMMTSGFLDFVRLADSILAEMANAGRLRPEVHREALRSALIGMFEGMLRDRLLAERSGFPAKYTSADMRRIFDLMVSAVAPTSR